MIEMFPMMIRIYSSDCMYLAAQQSEPFSFDAISTSPVIYCGALLEPECMNVSTDSEDKSTCIVPSHNGFVTRGSLFTVNAVYLSSERCFVGDNEPMCTKRSRRRILDRQSKYASLHYVMSYIWSSRTPILELKLSNSHDLKHSRKLTIASSHHITSRSRSLSRCVSYQLSDMHASAILGRISFSRNV